MKPPIPQKLSDIEISRVYEVLCEECGVVDAPRSYATALSSRRLHWSREHRSGER